MTVGGGVGLSTTHASALQDTWALRYGKPLVTPRCASPEYLCCIFTGSLTAALPWQHSWAAQIISALAWAQVAPSSDYPRMAVMRALHKAVRRVYCASPWGAKNTMHAVYAIAHCQPCLQHTAVARLIHWLHRRAQWNGTAYTDTSIP